MTPALKLNNNINFPLIGLGTSQAKPGEMEKAVKEAIDIGYRHFDSAMIYGNDQEVGTAIREKIADGYVKREDLFITNKEGDTLFPTDETGKLIPSDVDYVDTWKAMEECVKLGLAKSIGLSNFNSQQIQRVLDVATIKPVVNQVECHPYFNQSKMIAFCKERGIVVTAYAPFGRPGSTVNYIRHDVAPLLQDTKLQEIATKRDKTVAQVILRYLIQHGVVPIPKSSNKSRLQENFDVFNFELTPVEISSIDALNSDSRIFTYSLFADLKDYPFNTEF
ncbi:1,5-anhydro-D-fructose reductase-like isoform X2 [Zootermopsis nevadensis]|uniref:1,5-anhydro-D-fructose reductase-like isoform X2 n=1 Tax=Zootermopsis nevadensis TaxID=136037 RepID=UPI000B8E69BB|nr:1,5-anhydro-D-fructose reductase-like isoform X2 [Zootermopsis nevadensis]